jgi:hypothetical protein
LPPARHGGIAHYIPELLPTRDQFTDPNGMRIPREQTRRRPVDSASVTVTLMDCDWNTLAKGEACRNPSLDVTHLHMFTELGMTGITDFPHYHFDPEADERSACLWLQTVLLSMRPGHRLLVATALCSVQP